MLKKLRKQLDAYLGWVEGHAFVVGGFCGAAATVLSPVAEVLPLLSLVFLSIVVALVLWQSWSRLHRPFATLSAAAVCLAAYYMVIVWLPPGLSERLKALEGDPCGISIEIGAAVSTAPFSARLRYVKALHPSIVGCSAPAVARS